MAKTSPSKHGAAGKTEPKRVPAGPSADAVKGWPAGETLRPLLEAKAPPAKSRRRVEPAAAKAPNAALKPAAPPRPAKAKPPAPRRAARRTLSEIQTGPAPAEPPQPNPQKPAEAAASTPAARPERAAATAPPPGSAPAKPPGPGAPLPAPDVEALAQNIAQAIEQGSRALAAYLRPRESGEIKTTIADDIGEMVRSIGRVAEYYMAEPQRAFAAQAALTTQFVDLWAATLQRLQGAKAEPIAPPDASDKRFADAAWRDNPYFDFIKQAYVLTTRWADDLVKHADELEPHDRDKAQFYLRQVTAALSPSNFLATNPELLRTTLAESGENLVRGLKMLAEDIQAGHGNLRIRQADARAFKLGVNLAATSRSPVAFSTQSRAVRMPSCI